MIFRKCKFCGAHLLVPPSAIGKKVKCQKCGEIIQIEDSNTLDDSVAHPHASPNDKDAAPPPLSLDTPKRQDRHKSEKEYKVVPGPMGFSVKEGHANEAFSDFASLINANCGGGWEFHSMETITVQENPGCLGGGEKNATSKIYYMLIFVREKPESRQQS